MDIIENINLMIKGYRDTGKSVKKIISLNENKIFLDKKFKINLNSNEFNIIKIIIQKDIDFLHSIGANLHLDYFDLNHFLDSEKKHFYNLLLYI